MDDFLDVEDLPNEDGGKTECGTIVPELECSPDAAGLLSLCIKGVNEAIADTT